MFFTECLDQEDKRFIFQDDSYTKTTIEIGIAQDNTSRDNLNPFLWIKLNLCGIIWRYPRLTALSELGTYLRDVSLFDVEAVVRQTYPYNKNSFYFVEASFYVNYLKYSFDLLLEISKPVTNDHFFFVVLPGHIFELWK